MVCEHLEALERALLEAGVRETSRGQAWSKRCREWVYFDCLLDLEACRRRFDLADCVEAHLHRGTHDGSEAGLTCSIHLDGVMGRHPADAQGVPRFP